MISKFLRPTYKLHTIKLIKTVSPQLVQVRHAGDYIPPSQYDIPFPNRLKLGWAMRNHWEITPLVVSTVFAISLVFLATVWAIQHKVDVVWSPHNRNSIARTMDLRHPTVNKMLTINQEYRPWPEMQDVLDKMSMAEKRALVRATACSHP